MSQFIVRPHINTAFRWFIFLLILLFLPSLVAGKYIGKGYEYFFLLIGMFFSIYSNMKGLIYSKAEERLILFGVSAFTLVMLGAFQQSDEMSRLNTVIDVSFKALLPLMLIPFLYRLKVRHFSLFLWGAILAALISILMSIYGVWNAYPRGGGTVHGAAIIFGNLSMLFGVIILVVSFYFYKTKWFFMLLVVGIFGVLSSLLSGTRGGWIVLITLPFVLIPLAPAQYRIRLILSFLIITTVLVGLSLYLYDPISARLIGAYYELKQYLFEDTYQMGSVAARLELWRASLLAFISSPLIGIGSGEFYVFKLGLVEEGLVSASLTNYKHSHSEYMTILSGMGLLGVVFYLTFFIWLWRYFTTAAKSTLKEVKIMGLTGLSTIVCYLDFSLTESFLSSHLGSGAFYFLITFFVYYINLFSKKEKCASLSH